jgi:polyhydroxyalkanoate synthase
MNGRARERLRAAKRVSHQGRWYENLPADPEAWLAGAAQHPGSWWPHWSEWLSQHAGGKVKARIPGKTGSLKAIEDAPGSYVKARS